jgi:hypothetical protein
MTRASPAGLALCASSEDLARSSDSASAGPNQSPLEDYGRFLPHDKRALFELARVHLLAGRWQGPGCIREMRGRRP